MNIPIKNSEDIVLMRSSCQLAAKTLRFLGTQLRAGMSTGEIDRLCHEYIVSRGAIPSPLNYHGFPKSVCTSRNAVICHGIPDDKEIIKDGDIINIDVTTFLNGFHGDTSATFLIGNVRPEIKKLVEVANKCMMKAISICKPGVHLGDIGFEIQRLAHLHGYSVVREYCGHGIGREFHEEPQVLHYGECGKGIKLKPGMVITIEPMINFGKRHCEVLDDGWTVVTLDGSWSAQFENTILITDSGCEVLTFFPEENWKSEDTILKGKTDELF